MDNTVVVRGRYAGRTFIPDGPLPLAEGAAELIITPTPTVGVRSVADAFGTAAVLRSGSEILSQTQSEREGWDNR